MDPIKQEKYQAMKRYNILNNILSSLMLYSLLVMIFCLFFWLPTLLSSIRLFFIESLPKLMERILGPKFLFLIFNLIVIFLVGESRMSINTTNIYEEYVMHTRCLKRVDASVDQEKENEVELVSSAPLVEDKKLEVELMSSTSLHEDKMLEVEMEEKKEEEEKVFEEKEEEVERERGDRVAN